MKEHQTKYTCDKCNKQFTTNNGVGFPYFMGWCYLYKFNGKFESTGEKIINKTDRHFCSKKCLLEYLKEQIKKS